MAEFLPSAMHPLVQWVAARQAMFGWIGAVSLVLSVLGILLIPKIVCRLPSGYFFEIGEVQEGRRLAVQKPVARVVLQNILGLSVFLVGIVLVFIPGQGLVTMFLGLLLLSFPGKRRFVLVLFQKPSVGGALNWIRRRGGVAEFDPVALQN